MKPTPFIVKLKQVVPDDILPWLTAALRQDAAVWESLQNAAFGDRALVYAGDQPALWSPASLALLALDEELSLAALREDSLQSLNQELHRKAALALEETTTGNQPPAENHHPLAASGLLALALRERRWKTNSWDDLIEVLNSTSLEIWKTPLACLFMMAPDAEELLFALLQPESSKAHLHLALNAFLSNPLSPDEQSAILLNLSNRIPARERQSLLRQIAVQRPGLAASLARQLDTETSHPFLLASNLDNQLNQIDSLLQRAEIHQISNSVDRATPLLEEAQIAARRLQVDLSGQLARIAAENDDPVGALAAWQESAVYAPDSVNVIANHALAFLEVGKPEEAIRQLTRLDESFDPQHHTALLLAIAHIALDQENLEKARQSATQALDNLNDKVDLSSCFDHLESLIPLLLNLGLSAEAEQAANLAITRQPNNPELLAYLSQAQIALGQAWKAVETAQVAVALNSDEVNYRRLLADTLEAVEQWEDAYVEREAVLQKSETPSDQDRYALANCALHNDMPLQAIEVCRTALESNPEDGMAHALLGEAYQELKEAETAQAHFRKATQHTPHLARPWLALAQFQQSHEQHQEAIKTLKKGVKNVPDAPEIQLSLGEAYLIDESPSKALSVLQKTAKSISQVFAQPSDLSQKVSLRLGQTLNQLGQYEEARQLLEIAHQASPAHIELAHVYAQTLLELNQPAPALTVLAAILIAEPGYPEPYMDYGRAQLLLGEKPQEAIQAFERALQINPLYDEALALLADAYAANGEFTHAFQLYQQALESDLAQDEGWRSRLCVGLARAALVLEQPETAIAILDELANETQQTPEILRTLSEAYFAAGLKDNAMMTARAAQGCAPEDIETLIWFGELAFRLDAEKEAIKALERAAQLAPTQTHLQSRLGHALLFTGNTTAAEKAFTQILESEHATTNDLRHAARGFLRLDRPDRAAECLTRALTLEPEASADLLVELAEVHQANEELEEALKVIEQAITGKSDDPTLYITKADLLLELKRPQAALACLEHAGNLQPEDASLYKKMARVLRSAGEYAEALVQAQEAIKLSPEDPALYYLAADLARTNLQTDLARKLINLETPQAFQDNQLFKHYHCLRAELALEANQEVAAAEALTIAIQIDSNHPRVLALQSRLTSRRGDKPAAEKVLETALETIGDQVSPKDEHATNTLLSAAEAALDLEHWDACIFLLKQAVANSPRESLPHLRLARALVSRAEVQRKCQTMEAVSHAPGEAAIGSHAHRLFKGAMQAVGRGAMSEHPHLEITRWQVRGPAVFHPNAHNIQAFSALPPNEEDTAAWMAALRESGDFEGARQIAKDFPDSHLVQAELALTLESVHPTEAIAAIKNVIELCPSNPFNHVILARIAPRTGEVSLAVQAIQTALAIYPGEPRWHALAAKLCRVSGNSSAAIKHLETASQLEPKYTPHFLALGHACLENRMPGKAVTALERACHLEPENLEAWLALAKAHHSNGDLPQATTCAERAITLAPSNIAPLLLRSKIALQSDDIKNAEKYAKAALRIQPNEPEVLVLMARVLDTQDRPEEALRAVENILPLADDPLPLLLERARLLRRSVGFGAALEALQETAKKYPNHSEVLAPLAAALAEAGQSKEAVQYAQRALRGNAADLPIAEQANLHYLVGHLLRRAGQLDQAIHHLSEAIRQSPALLDPYLELGRAQQERRQYNQALQTYEQAIEVVPDDSRPYYQAGLILKGSKDYIGAEAMLKRASALAPRDVTIQRKLAAVVALNLVHHPAEAS